MKITKINQPKGEGLHYSYFQYGEVVWNECQGTCLVTEKGPINLCDGKTRSSDEPFFKVSGEFQYYIER